MTEGEDIYGLDPVEVIVRFSERAVAEFNRFNDVKLDHIRAALNDKELECAFQKLSNDEHKIYVPLAEGLLVLFVKEHNLTITYEANVRQKNKSHFTTSRDMPQVERLLESVKVRIIDINEGGKINLPSPEFEELRNKINQLEVASSVNVSNQRQIWNKWIEAQRAILNDLQKPFEVKNTFTLQEVKGNSGDIVRYSLIFQLASDFLPEYGQLEKRLLSLGIDVKVDSEGTLLLTQENLPVLDAVLAREFNEVIERDPLVGAVLGLKGLNLAARIESQLSGDFDVTQNERQERIIINCRAGVDIVEVMRTSGLVFSEYRAEFTVINHGDIISNTEFNKKKFLTFGRGEKDSPVKERSLPVPIENTFRVRSSDYEDLLLFYTTLTNIYGKENIQNKLYTLFQPEAGKQIRFLAREFSEEYFQELRRNLYVHQLEDSLNTGSRTLFLQFKDEPELRNQVQLLEGIKSLSILKSPLDPDFKFKIRLNVVAKKTQKELFLERIKNLRGAEFTFEYEVESKRRPQQQYIGLLNSHESDLSRLTLDLPCRYPGDKKKTKEVLSFLQGENKPLIRKLTANLAGDASKLKWLETAVKKVTIPSDSPNGKPINPKLGEYLFDTSKADPVFDLNKLNPDSEEYNWVKSNELLRLNDSQRKAVISAINSTDLALLQGPPGTGKTTVIAEMIWQIISRDPKHRILLTSETNLAVDNALDRLLNTKGVAQKLSRFTTLIKPMRFGRMSKLDEEGAKYSVERILQWADPNYKPTHEVVTTLDERIDDNEESVEKNSPDNNAVQDWMKRIADRAMNNDPKYAVALRDWAFDLAMPTQPVKNVFTSKYFEYSNVVGSTCSSAGSPNFMWNLAEHVQRKDVSIIRRLNTLAINVPFAKEFVNVISSYNVPSEQIDTFRNLLRPYKYEEQLVFSYFKGKGDSDVQVDDIKSLETVDEQPLMKFDDRSKLNTANRLIEFSREFIAPYFEQKIEFDTVIMDEASKATPPELLLPLCFGKRSIVIGDHRQLPPMLNEKDFKELLSEAGASHLLNEIDREFTETSQFERMILNPMISPTIISRCNIQYRMHPDINDVIQQFYLDEGGLQPSQELMEHANDPDLNNPFSRSHGLFIDQFLDPNIHTVWVNVTTPEMREGTSVTNEGEAQAIKKILQLLKANAGFEGFQNHWNNIKDEFKRQQEQQVGVISFYGAQKRVINREVRGVGIPLKVNTVDRFQGMERNIVIVSTVRSNEQKKFGGKLEANKDSGFAKSPQRLNVALSRARRLLIVVGNLNYFSNVTDSKGNRLYKNAIEKIQLKGRVIDFAELNKLE